MVDHSLQGGKDLFVSQVSARAKKHERIRLYTLRPIHAGPAHKRSHNSLDDRFSSGGSVPAENSLLPPYYPGTPRAGWMAGQQNLRLLSCNPKCYSNDGIRGGPLKLP